MIEMFTRETVTTDCYLDGGEEDKTARETLSVWQEKREQIERQRGGHVLSLAFCLMIEWEEKKV